MKLTIRRICCPHTGRVNGSDKVFPAELLAGVILGARMAPVDKRAVEEWIGERKCYVELLEARVASKSFSLKIRPYEG